MSDDFFAPVGLNFSSYLLADARLLFSLNEPVTNVT